MAQISHKHDISNFTKASIFNDNEAIDWLISYNADPFWSRLGPMLGPWNMHTTSVWDMRPFKAKDTKLLLQTALVEYVKNGTDDETFARMIGKQRERYIIHHD